MYEGTMVYEGGSDWMLSVCVSNTLLRSCVFPSSIDTVILRIGTANLQPFLIIEYRVACMPLVPTSHHSTDIISSGTTSFWASSHFKDRLSSWSIPCSSILGTSRETSMVSLRAFMIYHNYTRRFGQGSISHRTLLLPKDTTIPRSRISKGISPNTKDSTYIALL
ncbi:hypothetical protein AUEXF2481DRAFT_636665 [Aureobasidium subglaciale EXF-2481]|uniref:Uncharacterized protein n=1 Tax=Aureobasidium subglaciale (strain EXF-2481) TaxID=1043005 RepID=A0A074YF71_AURSE|nr:uncharacterized protein AUEXF2481DRAFT_636665 [Aureobasidium subglaciale EXF-2481]KEQ96400.1 hypothetical protein AUEXF2481DRAFT_636665 [Aureobasidium subglaciale EXF-2481]